MALKLHNTLTGRIEEFVSQSPGKVLLYTCGPTVYDYLHVGNWASYIYWDVLVRALKANNYEVKRVMNITDVGHMTSDADEGEDKLIKGAKREGKTAWQIAAFYGDSFIEGMKQLNMVEPQFYAKATDYIADQLNLVRVLKQKGYTYQINDGIYFDTSKFPTYADFAHLNIDEQKAGARVEYNPEKRNISDFALWKFTPNGEKRDMEWETPEGILEQRVTRGGAAPSEPSVAREEGADRAAGPASELETFDGNQPATGKVMGFPGWHLECSAIALTLLGDTLDIHTGGIDHIPVHHTNEIAQSEAATGVRFSNFWLHNNFLKVNGAKIAKSLQNGYTLDDIREHGFSSSDFRMFILQSHYRSEGNFTFEALESAKNRLNNWRNVAALRHQIHNNVKSSGESGKASTLKLERVAPIIIEAIGNDLGTPEALKQIDETFSTIVSIDPKQINRQSLVELLEEIDQLTGLQLIESTPDISDELKQMILERNSARSRQDWPFADKLRDEIAQKGIVLRDLDAASIWEYKAQT